MSVDLCDPLKPKPLLTRTIVVNLSQEIPIDMLFLYLVEFCLNVFVACSLFVFNAFIHLVLARLSFGVFLSLDVIVHFMYALIIDLEFWSVRTEAGTGRLVAAHLNMNLVVASKVASSVVDLLFLPRVYQRILQVPELHDDRSSHQLYGSIAVIAALDFYVICLVYKYYQNWGGKTYVASFRLNCVSAGNKVTQV